MIVNPFSKPRISSACFAFVSSNDPLCDGLSLPDDANRVRLMGYEGIPLFALYYEKTLMTLSPYEILTLIAEDRISFRSDVDKEVFVALLTEALDGYDRANRAIQKITRTAIIAGSAVLAVSALALGIVAGTKIHKRSL